VGAYVSGAEMYDTVFLASETIAPATASFRFETPAGFEYAAGQFALVSLGTTEGEQTKAFTLSSAPGDPHLEITTRLTGSAFKDALLGLHPGDLVRLSGPRGRMVATDDAGRIAFLSGGVGVTPARSIVRDSVQRAAGRELVLFYGNRDEGSIPFGAEFDGYAAADPRIRVVHVLERPGPGWAGETGFITASVVRRHVDPLDGWRFFVSGPPAMIEPMRLVVTELAVPDERLTFESFAGYR
jgi:ferredoxin-NADP reductase